MANSRMPWFRLYSEILDDKKIKRICRATSFNKATVIGVWVIILALANDSDDRGTLQISENIPYEIADIAYEVDLPDDQVDTLMKLFEKYHMLSFDSDNGWHIKNWDGRQFKSDNSTARVRKWREEQKKQEETSQPAEVKRYSNVIDTESDTESESDTEDISKKLTNSFCEITGISLPNNTSTYAKWLTEVNEWIAMNATEDNIKQAYETAMEKDYTVARPQSLTNFIRGAVAKNNHVEKKNTEIYPIDDGTLRNAYGEVVGTWKK